MKILRSTAVTTATLTTWPRRSSCSRPPTRVVSIGLSASSGRCSPTSWRVLRVQRTKSEFT